MYFESRVEATIMGAQKLYRLERGKDISVA